MAYKARYWHKISNTKIQCDLCPRECKLKNGQKGFCFVREAQNDTIVLNAYGKSTGFCIDPVEKKPLYHFYPGSAVLSFGTAGCNLSCNFCQNSDISTSRQVEIMSTKASPAAITKAAKSNSCKSVAFTYNDPVIFAEYAIDTALACREENIKTIAVSAGYIKDKAREDFFSVMDAANIDFKSFNHQFYKKLCGVELDYILETLKIIHQQTNLWLEITTLLIPNENDNEKELSEMSAWVYENLGPDTPWHFSAFHPSWKMQNKKRTSLASLQRARTIAKKAGMNYVYIGNVIDIDGGSTYCSSCGKALIVRDSYNLTKWNLQNEGHCKFCGKRIAGYFDNSPGNWGNKRHPISLSKYL